ncbi:MAG: peptide chain release factor 1 [Candidatus Xenobiia bacterium LiM19]
MEKRLDKIEERYEELNRMLCDSEVISDQNRYREIGKERSDIEEMVVFYRSFKKLSHDLEESRMMIKQEEDKELRDFIASEIAEMERKLEAEKEKLLFLLIPKDPNDEKDIIMEIRAGAGGEEAALFAGELFRMYGKYAEKKHWKVELWSSNETGLGGYKEVIFSITGKRVYSKLKFESGVHRVQRVPATEASGRIHTSTVTVAVLVEPEEVEIQINPNDLRIDTYRSSGAGGQHVNKTDSAVRITHLPTNIVVACQDERSQHQNREKAMRILRAKLLEQQQISQDKEIAEARKLQVGSGDRSEKIRTYNFPQSRITDHRIGFTAHNLELVLEGEIEDLLEALASYSKKTAIQG